MTHVGVVVMAMIMVMLLKHILHQQHLHDQAAFGKEEGGRLDSQIILSRNQTKYTQGWSTNAPYHRHCYHDFSVLFHHDI